MASVEIAAPGLFARDILAYSDAELGRYLEENGRDLTHRTSATTQSRPVDADQVAARLEQYANRERSPSVAPSVAFSVASSVASSLATAPPLSEKEQYQQDLRIQIKYYNALVDAGGRPSYPLSRIEDIVKSPGEYGEILSFWQRRYPEEDNWKVFSAQLDRWLEFQRLQRYARGQSAHDYWRSEWDDKRKIHLMVQSECLGRGDDPYTESAWKHEWQRIKERWGDRRIVFVSGQYRLWVDFVRRKGRTTEEQGFPEYAEALKERLAMHGFTRTFQLDEDLARQDKLTTWIEYLGYEYWWYDEYTEVAEHRQQKHDDAWKKLVDSKVLKPEETEEVICDIDRSFRDCSEEKRAEKAVQWAWSIVSSAEIRISQPQKYRYSPQKLQQWLVEAQSKLKAAEKRYESLKRRRDHITEFIHRTEGYRIAMRDAKRHSILLQWVLQQFPSIEDELNPPGIARNNSNQRVGGRKRKQPEGLDQEQHSQKRRHNEGNMRSISDQKTSLGSVSQGREGRGLRASTATDDRPAFERRKNSGQGPNPPRRQTSDLSDSTESAGTLNVSKTPTRIAYKAWEVNGNKFGEILDTPDTTTNVASKPRDNKVSLDPPSRTPKPLRRSSRIAQREQRLLAAAVAPSANYSR